LNKIKPMIIAMTPLNASANPNSPVMALLISCNIADASIIAPLNNSIKPLNPCMIPIVWSTTYLSIKLAYMSTLYRKKNSREDPKTLQNLRSRKTSYTKNMNARKTIMPTSISIALIFDLPFLVLASWIFEARPSRLLSSEWYHLAQPLAAKQSNPIMNIQNPIGFMTSGRSPYPRR